MDFYHHHHRRLYHQYHHYGRLLWHRSHTNKNKSQVSRMCPLDPFFPASVFLVPQFISNQSRTRRKKTIKRKGEKKERKKKK
ncbi:hypothetical protein E2C01_085504 [Portunus trituberculatus]|uniref:Uncharacterized protein n=1 Tax=Portunus trituberculatus TaxID=210409 RepID=A0A5B7JDT4_PORTR|nr:hypothetical protein [Portunus trituberculatus]